MKKTSVIACLLVGLLLSGCGLPVRFTEVRGSGQIETESRHVSGFQSVNLSGIGTLIIEQGEKESLDIITDKNLLEYIQSDVSGENLQLSVQDFVNIQPTDDVVYHLTVTDLTSVETSGLGNIEIQSLNADNLQLDISGAGNISIADLTAEALNLEISGMGNVDLSGRVTDQVVKISGTGNYQAGDLFSRQANVEISGTGSAEIWAADKLNLQLSGMGNLDYYGSPIVNMDISGMGKVNSLGSK